MAGIGETKGSMNEKKKETLTECWERDLDVAVPAFVAVPVPEILKNQRMKRNRAYTVWDWD